MKPEITEVPTVEQMRAMAERLEAQASHAADWWRTDEAALCTEAAAMLTALADDMERVALSVK